jgi:hypothetical protein
MRWRCKRSEEVDRTPAAAQPPPCPSYPGCSNRHSHVQGLFLYTHVSLDLHTQKASLCCCICTRTQGHATQYSPDSFSILVDIPVGTGQSVPAAKRSEKSRLHLGGPASPFPCACSTYMRVCVCCVCVCVCVCVQTTISLVIRVWLGVHNPLLPLLAQSEFALVDMVIIHLCQPPTPNSPDRAHTHMRTQTHTP